MHVDWDSVAVNVPTKQDEQIVAVAAEYFPASQLPVTADNPAYAQNEPAVQALQALSPADAAKVPVEQNMQAE